MSQHDELVYTTVFKTYNLELESSPLNLADQAWIERKQEYVGFPTDFSPSMLMFDRAPFAFGLTRFYKQLLESDTILGASHTETPGEHSPFDVHDCSHIAIALSVLKNTWFVAGIEKFSNSKYPEAPSLGPWTTLFLGRKSEQLIVRASDEPHLSTIYQFVRESLCMSMQNDSKRKLLFLYLRVIVNLPTDSVIALKTGIPALLSGRASVLVNAAIFFEHVFTTESWNHNGGRAGVQTWNTHFASVQQVSFDDVQLVMNYRHDFVHDSASVAKRHIADWKSRNDLSDEQAFELVEQKAVITVKEIMRSAAMNHRTYEAFKSDLT